MDLTPSPAPRVWHDLDQAELDRAYDQAQWARGIAQTLAVYAERSQALRSVWGAPQRLAYGPGAREQLDFFSCGQARAPLLVFVHGGAWRSGAAHDYAFVATPFLKAGIHVAVLDFDAVQDCGGQLLEMARQVRTAVAWLQAAAARLGAAPELLHLVGHSSGAHLAAAVATGDGQDWAPLTLASLSCISGLYELEPVRRSSRSRYVGFSDESVQRLSPTRHARHLRCRSLVAHAEGDSPQFQWQAQAWCEALTAAGPAPRTCKATGLNHFEVLLTLGEPGGLLAEAVLALVGQDAQALESAEQA